LDFPEPNESIANQIAVQLPGVGIGLDNRCLVQTNVHNVPAGRCRLTDGLRLPEPEGEEVTGGSIRDSLRTLEVQLLKTNMPTADDNNMIGKSGSRYVVLDNSRAS